MTAADAVFYGVPLALALSTIFALWVIWSD